MRLNKEIIKKSKPHLKQYKEIINAIKKYDRIAIFRHLTPDYDALGSQLAMEQWIKTNFPNKEVICLGDSHVLYTGTCFREMDSVNNSWFAKPFLAIFLDVANIKRIADPRYKNAEFKIKIDHHPLSDKYADIELIDESFVSCSEFIANMFMCYSNKYEINTLCARNIYMGIVGDSGGFKYQHTSVHTFVIASEIVKRNLDVTEISQVMFHKPKEDLDLRKYVLDTYTLSEHGVACYVLTAKKLNELNIEVEQGKECINMFQNIEGIGIWMSVTEDAIAKEYRASIRSLSTPINGVASHYNGGGHPNASGAKLKSLNELPKLIKDLDDLLK